MRLLVLVLAGCGGASSSTPTYDDPAAGCEATGGTVTTASCCTDAPFPDFCAGDGACGCAPEDSVEAEICSCPDLAAHCFDALTNTCRAR